MKTDSAQMQYRAYELMNDNTLYFHNKWGVYTNIDTLYFLNEKRNNCLCLEQQYNINFLTL